MAKINTRKFRDMDLGQTVTVGHNRRVSMTRDEESRATWLTFTYHDSDVVVVAIPFDGYACDVWVDAHEFFTASTMAGIRDGLELFFAGCAGVSRAKGQFSASFAGQSATEPQDGNKCLTFKVEQHWLNHHKAAAAETA